MFVLRSTYQKQLDKNAELIEDRDSLRRKLIEAQQAPADITQPTAFAVDFDILNPFSIERNVHEGRACTIFGYFDKDGNVSEWFWFCSLECHNKLVESYHGYKAKKEARQATVSV